MKRGKAWVQREKREQKEMAAPGARRLGVKGRGESRAGEGGHEALTEVRWHGRGLQQVTGFSEGRDWGRIISEHSIECVTWVSLWLKLSLLTLHFKAMGVCSPSKLNLHLITGKNW